MSASELNDGYGHENRYIRSFPKRKFKSKIITCTKIKKMKNMIKFFFDLKGNSNQK